MEGAVSTSHVGEKLGALLKLFLRSEEDYESRDFIIINRDFLDPVSRTPFKLLSLGLLHFKLIYIIF